MMLFFLFYVNINIITSFSEKYNPHLWFLMTLRKIRKTKKTKSSLRKLQKSAQSEHPVGEKKTKKQGRLSLFNKQKQKKLFFFGGVLISLLSIEGNLK